MCHKELLYYISDNSSLIGERGITMVKSTFTNLPTAKRQKIEAVLLEEFSTYPLAQAKVSHIVKKADIARGAFYKYFDDLTDAYLYMYHIAIETIHTNMSPDEKFDPDHFYDRVICCISHASHIVKCIVNMPRG